MKNATTLRANQEETMVMSKCRRCGREATHATYDGYDSHLSCAEYPNCTGDPSRDPLGRMVRAIWIEWAHQQPVAKAHWITPYDELDEPDKEVDRRIGERIAARVFDEVGVTVAAVDGGVEALRSVAKLRTKWLGSAR